MSYIFVVDEDKLKESLINDFLSGKECLILHKNNVNEIIKVNGSLEEYCLEYADKLFYENCHRISSMGPDETIRFCFTPAPSTINRNNKLGTYAPSAIKAMLDKFENEKDQVEEIRFEVGDVITYPFNGYTVCGLITKLEKMVPSLVNVTNTLVYLIRKDGTTDLCILGEDGCEKTGRHYDSIDEFMKED